MRYYYESKSDTQNYHYINHKSGPYAAPHFHASYEMLLVRRGRMMAVINGEEFVIAAGHGCFVNSFFLHSYSELEQDTEVYAFVGNSSAFDTALAALQGIPPKDFVFDDFSLLEKIVAYYRDADENGIRYSIFCGASALLLAIIAQKNQMLPVENVDDANKICAVLRYISEHFTEELTLTSLSARFGYSPQYFSRLFHRYVKDNLTEYINVARVNHARKLLESCPEKNVAEIAFDSGFSSIPSFYRAYRRVFGSHPKG